ncbi:MAG TPA: serine--tRNA ligase, partial [Myxococcota bacterium]|nr:serine--tRNA ligase [Myxococcota bacterium]
MLDIRLIREQPEHVKAELAKVQCPSSAVDEILEADRRRREALHDLETRRADRARRSKEIGQLPPEERKTAGAAIRELADGIARAEGIAEQAESEFRARMLEIPNIPHPDVPVGPD